MKKLAFTLAELLICLGIIGICAMMIVSNLNKRPNNSMVLFRKAYNTTANNISDMIQTAGYYSDAKFSNLDATTIDVAGHTPSGNTKFCELFANKMTVVGEVHCENMGNQFDIPTFSTPDGIYWFLDPRGTMLGDWTRSATVDGRAIPRAETIVVDVNGKSRPNCFDGSPNCTNPDRFVIVIKDDGKIMVSGKAGEYLKSNSHISR